MNGVQMTGKPLISNLAKETDMVPLLNWYVSRLPERAAAIQQAGSTWNLKSVEQLSLALLESAGSYGFPSITEAARKVWRIARTRRRLDDLTKGCARLVGLCERARATDREGQGLWAVQLGEAQVPVAADGA
jgi:hypothetical protein